MSITEWVVERVLEIPSRDPMDHAIRSHEEETKYQDDSEYRIHIKNARYYRRVVKYTTFILVILLTVFILILLTKRYALITFAWAILFFFPICCLGSLFFWGSYEFISRIYMRWFEDQFQKKLQNERTRLNTATLNSETIQRLRIEHAKSISPFWKGFVWSTRLRTSIN